jgi:quercetin dioxygenase-like cupin family protein
MNHIENALITAGGDVVHHFCGGVYAKETHIPAGTVLGQHAHEFDHMSILASGRALVTIGEQSMPVHAPCALRVAAGKRHSVEAVTDVVWYCIWPEDAPDLKGDGHALG